ncbi:MAG: isoprenylcysteine carboxylmethyltransferase family protein [Candidatus Eremiobacteraeota bacterium]|nr:isoprenylcysteine carboxylmethyltransferase family protein [Candidatus Eremiobacteraeota bacterium]
MTEKKYSLMDRWRCLFRKEFYMILPNYIFFLIPIASIMAYLSHRYIDNWIGWKFPIPRPYNFIFFGVSLIVGFAGILWVYSYLILEGEGGPCPPFTSKTKRLVKTGAYSLCRHPSILFKLFGVIGLGCAFESISFLLIVIPTLLVFSLLANKKMQEDPLIEKFGDEYLEYKKKTPMLIPDFWKAFGWR